MRMLGAQVLQERRTTGVPDFLHVAAQTRPDAFDVDQGSALDQLAEVVAQALDLEGPLFVGPGLEARGVPAEREKRGDLAKVFTDLGSVAHHLLSMDRTRPRVTAQRSHPLRAHAHAQLGLPQVHDARVYRPARAQLDARGQDATEGCPEVGEATQLEVTQVDQGVFGADLAQSGSSPSKSRSHSRSI